MITGHEDKAVDLGRMPPGPPDRDCFDASVHVFRLTVRFDEYLKLLPDERLVFLERDRLLHFHDVVATSICLVLRNSSV